MVKKQKRQFHCQTCGFPCEIYKKGKKHRVMVCPQCGVLATNPVALVAGIAGRAIAKRTIGAVASNVLKDKTKDKEEKQKVIRESYSTEERVRDALK